MRTGGHYLLFILRILMTSSTLGKLVLLFQIPHHVTVNLGGAGKMVMILVAHMEMKSNALRVKLTVEPVVCIRLGLKRDGRLVVTDIIG